jgi:integrase
MAKGVNRLTAKFVERVAKPGLYHDGRGLYLHVGDNFRPGDAGGKSWLGRFQLDGKTHWPGLGSYPETSLGRAREKWEEDRWLLKAEGVNPLEARRTEREARKAAAAKSAAEAITFRLCAEKFIAAHEAGWKNPVYRKQWTQTLADYAYPVIRDLPVAAVETGHVTQILQPIWTTKTETASRLRGRIENVLDYAKTHGWRTGENPARWKGHLENVLPQPGKVAKVEHHAAMPWREIGAFMAELEKQDGIGALALRFTILTAARTGEVIGAPWAEIDMREQVWTVPAERMKAEREHRVPLCGEALEVLTEASKFGAKGFVFPGGRAGKPLSNMAMLAVLKRMSRGDLTTHGFRSTFRDWAAETGKPADIAEAALAHVLGDKTVAAYQRGDLLQRRSKLMQQWAEWCSRPTVDSDNVVELRVEVVA